VTTDIVEAAYAHGVRLLELRYSPIIHTYGGLTPRQAIRSVLSGINVSLRRHADLEVGVIIISMRQHGPHIAKIIARQALAEAQHLHERSGVVGFDLAGAERGNPPRLFRDAYEIARRGGLGLTVHAGEDEGPENVWEAIDLLGADRIGHGCSAVRDRRLLKRLARDRILVECCPTSNVQTGAVASGAPHPIYTFLEHGIPVAVCTDNTTVSDTDQTRENRLLLDRLGLKGIEDIHRNAADYSFIRRAPFLLERAHRLAPGVTEGRQGAKAPLPGILSGQVGGAGGSKTALRTSRIILAARSPVRRLASR
jgi:adenosine deaminase